MANETATKKFEVGKTYQTRSVGDSNCLVKIVVVSRTDKTVTCQTDDGVKKFRPSVYRGVEQVKPWGSFSMAPIVGADDETR